MNKNICHIKTNKQKTKVEKQTIKTPIINISVGWNCGEVRSWWSVGLVNTALLYSLAG